MTDRTSSSGDQLFKGMDETERIYAPEDVPDTNLPPHEVDVGGTAGATGATNNEPPAAAPVSIAGSSSPSSAAAPPNIGNQEHGGAPGDPETEAGYPLDDRDSSGSIIDNP